MKRMTTPKERRKKERNKYEISSVFWKLSGGETKFSLYDHKSTFKNSDRRNSSHTHLDWMFNNKNLGYGF